MVNYDSIEFKTLNHLYFYDEEEDIEQIRQKIGIYRNFGSQQKLAPKPQIPTKKTVWKKFEMDRQNNQENQQRVLGQGNLLIFCIFYLDFRLIYNLPMEFSSITFSFLQS